MRRPYSQIAIIVKTAVAGSWYRKFARDRDKDIVARCDDRTPISVGQLSCNFTKHLAAVFTVLASLKCKRSGRAMSNLHLTIADEVQAAIATGSAERCSGVAERVASLFIASAGSLDVEQHALFADVFERLVNTIELRALADVGARIALAELSAQLAPVPQAPVGVIRRLAHHDDITVAGPVLSESPRLNNEDLIEIAKTRSEKHLIAVAGRWWLQEIVTDALLARR